MKILHLKKGDELVSEDGVVWRLESSFNAPVGTRCMTVLSVDPERGEILLGRCGVVNSFAEAK